MNYKPKLRNRNMKNLIATLAIAAVFMGVATTANAQAAGPKGQAATGSETAERRAMDIRKDALAQLNLTQDQKAKIRALNKANKEKNKAFKAELDASTATEDVKREKSLAHRKEQLAALRAILTPEQQQKFDAYMDAERKKARQAKKDDK